MVELLVCLWVLFCWQCVELFDWVCVVDFEFDLFVCIVYWGGEEIIFMNCEFVLFEFLMVFLFKFVSKMVIVEYVWDQYFDLGMNVINVYVNYLWEKIDCVGWIFFIYIVCGVGYVLKEFVG